MSWRQSFCFLKSLWQFSPSCCCSWSFSSLSLSSQFYLKRETNRARASPQSASAMLPREVTPAELLLCTGLTRGDPATSLPPAAFPPRSLSDVGGTEKYMSQFGPSQPLPLSSPLPSSSRGQKKTSRWDVQLGNRVAKAVKLINRSHRSLQ